MPVGDDEGTVTRYAVAAVLSGAIVCLLGVIALLAKWGCEGVVGAG